MAGSIEKGIFHLVVSQAVFFVAGVLIYFVLGKWLLSPVEFGEYGVVIAFISIIYTVLNSGMDRTVAKFVSEKNELAETIKRKSILLQAAISAVSVLAVFLLSDSIALLLNDISLSPLIKVSSFLLFTHPMFSVFTGYLNGLKRFSLQSLLTSFYTVLKLLLVVGFVLAGFGVAGAIGGFVFASALTILICALFLRGKEAGGRLAYSGLVFFGLPIMVFSLAISLLTSVDILLVKSLTAASSSSLMAAYYTAASTVSRLPLIAIYAFTLVLFPLVSETTFHGNARKSRFYVENSLRYSLLLIVPLVAMIASTSGSLLSLVYSSKYLGASEALFFLTFSAGFFALFLILATIISSAGKPGVSMAIAIVAVIIDIALNFALVPIMSIAGAAVASLAAVLSGTLLASAWVFRRFGVLASLPSTIRIIASGVVVYAVSLLFPAPGAYLILKYVLLLLLYIAMLAAMKEVQKRDFDLAVGMISG